LSQDVEDALQSRFGESAGNDFTQRFAMSGPLQCSNVGNVGVVAVAATKERRLQQNREAGANCRAKKKAAEAAKDVLIAKLQAEKAAAAIGNDQLALSLKLADQKQAEMSETIEQLTVKVRAKIASLFDIFTLASFADYEG
jgi:hypothetical protein